MMITRTRARQRRNEGTRFCADFLLPLLFFLRHRDGETPVGLAFDGRRDNKLSIHRHAFAPETIRRPGCLVVSSKLSKPPRGKSCMLGVALVTLTAIVINLYESSRYFDFHDAVERMSIQ